MDNAVYSVDIHNPGDATRLEFAAGLLGGAAFTFVLFFGMAYFGNFSTNPPSDEIEEARTISLPLEPLPPLPTVVQSADTTAEASVPFSGIEIGASNSPVSIAVVSAAFETLLQNTANMPQAKIQFNTLRTDLKPKLNLDADVRHVFQQTEVDQLPHAIVRTMPDFPPDVKGSAPALRVVLLILIDQQGTAESVRLVQSSGNPKFDELVVRAIKEEWKFSPAIRRGKQVRVLAQQVFRVKFTNGTSPFNIDR